MLIFTYIILFLTALDACFYHLGLLHGEVVLLAHATYYELDEIGMENSVHAMEYG